MKENAPVLKVCTEKFFKSVRDAQRTLKGVKAHDDEMAILMEINDLMKKLTWEQKHRALDYFKKFYNVGEPTITKIED